MASAFEFRNSQQRTSEELEELLEDLGKLLERAKVLYEQYFMGIQKLPPSQLHRDIERRIRELTQDPIRNTALRFRFTQIKSKYGSYNTYWQRVLRQIDQGTYVRDLQRVSRRAINNGVDIPEELLAKLPKRIQEKIRKDRDAIAEIAERKVAGKPAAEVPGAIAGPGGRQVFTLEDDDLGDSAIDDMFSALTSAPPEVEPAAPVRPPAPGSTVPPPAVRPSGSIPGLPSAAARATVPPPGGAPRATVPPPGGAPRVTAPPPGGAPRVTAPPPGGAPRVTAPPPRPGVTAPPPTDVRPPPGMDDKQCRDLYARYVKAREVVGKPGADLSYEKMVASLNQQAPAIMKQTGARGVGFDVVIKGDKVVLKAKPQK